MCRPRRLSSFSSDESYAGDEEEDAMSTASSDYDSELDSESDTDWQQYQIRDLSPIGSIPQSACVPLPAEIWERIMLYVSTDDLTRISKSSRQHRSISRKASFRARYFLRHHKRCEAIYEASCRPHLFTEELLETLLQMGAIMSRDFAQQFWAAYTSEDTSDDDYIYNWTKQIPARVYYAVLNVAYQLYEDTLKLEEGSDDMSTLIFWQREMDFELIEDDDDDDQVQEIFEVGRFAPFRKSDNDDGLGFSQNLIRYCPQMLDLLEQNGYDIEDDDVGILVKTLIYEVKEADDLYDRVDKLLKKYPHATLTTASCKILSEPDILGYDFGRLGGFDDNEKPTDHRSYQCSGEVSLSLLKRMYYEGKAFQDLDDTLVPFIERCLEDEAKSHYYAPGYRSLYKYFPHLLHDFQEQFGEAYCSAWQTGLYNHILRGDSEKSESTLLESLKELKLKPVQLLHILNIDVIPCKILLSALQGGLFGSNWKTYFIKIVRTLIVVSLSRCRVGQQFREWAKVVSQYQETNPIGAQDAISKDFYTDELHKILSCWEFDLDRLKPDDDDETAVKFRSPIAWMIEGSADVEETHYSDHKYHKALKPQDPYSLMITKKDSKCQFDSKSWPDYSGRIVNVAFAISYDRKGIDSFREEDTMDVEAAITIDLALNKSSKATDESIGSSKGWKHIGRLDAMTGEMIQLDDVFAIVEEMDAVLSPSTLSHDDLSAKDDIQPDEISKTAYPTTEDRVYTMTCSSNGDCDLLLRNDSIGASETAMALVELLGPDNPAIRDVLLSHAIVNGNVELLEKLMSGDHDDRQAIQSIEGKRDKRPVLPTMAHLLILQKLDRRPLDIFIKCILRGAPFKHGYVKSSTFYGHQRDDDVKERQKQYNLEGHKDDAAMASLYREKERLQRLNHSEENDQRSCKGILDQETSVSTTRANVESDLEEEDGSLKRPRNTFKRRKLEKGDTSSRSNLEGMLTHKNSLTLWREHLEVLQWLEERIRKLKQRKNEETGTKSKGKGVQFLEGLMVMIEKIVGSEGVLQAEIDARNKP